MVRAVVMACLGKGVRLDREAESFRRLLHHWIKIRALRADGFNALRIAQREDGVIVQAKRDLPGGNWRMLPQIFRTAQPLLLSGYSSEQDRTLRFLRRVS